MDKRAQSARTHLCHALLSVVLGLVTGWASGAAAPAPTVPISQVPMTIVVPAHPQILLTVANSESMDGDLSGAILTGAGSLSASLSALQASSSPVNYTVPTGFTPPVNAGTGGVAPYTVTNSAGLLLDNSASRLNVAKAGITSILNTYISAADFGLMDYSISGLTEATTWVYQMSQPGGFTFAATAGTPVPGTIEYVANPCYNVNISLANQVSADCAALNAHYAGMNMLTQPYMVVGASSDDPSINDVLYDPWGGVDPVCIGFGGVNPPSPYPPSPPGFTLADYEANGILESYNNGVNACALQTGPTNAGFVPYSAEVMYAQRGFGYYTGGQMPATGATLVPMTSAGATPTPTSVAAALANFTPYLVPETNSTGTNEMKAAATQSPMAGIIAGAQAFFAANPPSTNGCAAQQYVVLMTDGLPTQDLNGNAWPPLGSTAAAGYGVTATFNTDGMGNTTSLQSTNDQALTDVINNLTALNSTGVKTYIIGLGAGVNKAANPTAYSTLQAMAIAGGTSSFFPANTPQAVTNDLQIIITRILAATQSTASAAVNSTGLNTTSVVYQSQFLTSDALQDWTGNLFAFPISATTGIVNTTPPGNWAAQTELDAQNWDTGRLIATYDPTQSAGIPFRWNSGSPIHGIANSTTLGTKLTTFTPDPNGQDVLDYLRGDNSKEVRNPPGQFRNRTHKLGDIVDSNPLYIGAPAASIQSASYITFAHANAARPAVIYVGADDGMLHAFDAVLGTERFAYIPRGIYANLIDLVNPYYNATHQFYVNGSPQASDVQFSDSTWHTLLVGTEAAGGNSVFALDVTNPASITSEALLASSVLWDFTDPDMGLGFSTPAIASTSSGWQVFFGNGYNSPNQKPILYAVNPKTGATVAKIDLCATVATACNLSASNGLSSVIAVNTSGQLAGYANIVYAGDLQGNLWRVDVSNTNASLWTVSVLFQARDAGGNPQPITTSPVASLNPKYPQLLGTMVFFGTGKFLGSPDLATTQVQSIYGVYDPPSAYATPLTRSSLVQQTLTAATIGTQAVDVVTGNAVTLPTNKGWYIDLMLLSGERVVTDPRLESGGALVLTSYQPSLDPCTAGGQSMLYVINYANGGTFPNPQFDANGDGTINNGDLVTFSNGSTAVPVGMSLGSVFAAAPTIRTANFATGSAVKLITESNGTIKTVVEKGSTKSRTAWWEIRQ